MINWIYVIFVGIALIATSLEVEEDIRYFQPATIPYNNADKLVSVPINDSLARQEVRIGEPSRVIPVNYSMDLHTGICFDNKCRPLKIVVYWNITGRYLGFELLDEEYLSKYDHEPFTDAEYEQLHALLADPFLPLGDYAFEELVKIPDTGSEEVDGVSGATSKEVLQFVVEGAAYTTHKLWNIIHGPTRDQISLLTAERLDSYLFGEILQSADPSDQTWAAERVSLLDSLDDVAFKAISNVLRDGEYFQAYLLLKSLSSDQINADNMQLELIRLIGAVDPNIETSIIDRLLEANELSPMALDYSIGMIRRLSGPQLLRLLNLYTHHSIRDERLHMALKAVLPHDNKFVEQKVLQYLEQ